MQPSNIDSLEVGHDTPRPSKTNKNEEAQDVSSTSMKTTSISPKKGGDGGEIDGA